MSKQGAVRFILGLQPPVGGDDLVAHMAFLRGWALEAYSTSRSTAGHHYMITLTVPDDWAAAERDEFSAEVTRALELQRGMPWLDVRAVLAYKAAEQAVATVADERAVEMFALLRQTDRTGWGEVLRPVLDRMKPYAEEAGKQVVATAAVATLKALATLVGATIS